jgi:hypothetical protein
MKQQDIHQWISSIINSCTDDFHFEGVDKLIEIFNEKFKNESLTIDLQTQRAIKWNDIHAIVQPKLNK